MKKVSSLAVLISCFWIFTVTVQFGTTLDAHGAVTGSTSMTVVKVREWRTANTETPVNWSQKFGLYNYKIHGREQSWANSPSPIPFTKDYKGNTGGLIWAIYDEGGKTGNRSFVAYAWDFVGPYSIGKHEGGGVSVSDGWQGMMLSTICKETNFNGRYRSNIIFTAK